MDSARYYNLVGETGFPARDKLRFEQTLPHLLREGALLDVGCGEGYWLNFLSERISLTLEGIDVSKVRLSLAEERLKGKKIGLNLGDICDLDFDSGKFDQVTSLEVLEHVPDWEKGLTELLRIASKRVVITVPYNERLKYEVCRNCGARAYLSGHLNSFDEKTIVNFSNLGQMSFHFLPPLFGLTHYVKRAAKGVFRRDTKMVGCQERENGHGLVTICPQCYDRVPYTKYVERGFKRLERLVTNSPEYLLVQIDK